MGLLYELKKRIIVLPGNLKSKSFYRMEITYIENDPHNNNFVLTLDMGAAGVVHWILRI